MIANLLKEAVKAGKRTSVSLTCVLNLKHKSEAEAEGIVEAEHNNDKPLKMLAQGRGPSGGRHGVDVGA